MTAILELLDIRAAYGQIEVLHGIDVSVEPGKVLAVLGPNGAGKTTLVRVISGLLRPTHGRVIIAGTDVTGVRGDALARAGLCVIQEGPRHIPAADGGGAPAAGDAQAWRTRIARPRV